MSIHLFTNKLNCSDDYLGLLAVPAADLAPPRTDNEISLRQSAGQGTPVKKNAAATQPRHKWGGNASSRVSRGISPDTPAR